MFSTKAVLVAAGLAMAAMVGTGPANAAPYGRHLNRVEHRLEHRDARIHNHIARVDHRIVRHDRRALRHHRTTWRRHVDRARIQRILSARHYRMVGTPYYLGSRYVVHSYDRFGRGVLVQINPWTGAFMSVIRM